MLFSTLFDVSILISCEQSQLRSDIEDLDISLFDYTVRTDASGAVIALDSKWLGVRSGVSFGYRF